MTRFLAVESGEAEGRLDRFELIAELASGGMATVFLARLGGVAGFQRLVAIKRLHPHLARDPEFTQMFLDEARLAARLHHPNVVPILEIGESNDGYYLVMEYIEGDTLAHLLARSASSQGRAFPPQVAVRILLDTLSGLHAAHELLDDEGKSLDIVHRDVSPQNILCGVDGTSRITDFGVARAASRLTTTRSGQLKGKLAYMAPEQARGQPIDRRADVFAAGICLWEALAMRRLFKGEGEADTLNKVLYEPTPLLRAANPSAHPAFEAVCAKALAREPGDRYATMAVFADALEEAAREAGALGTHREVAAHLDAVLGTDISQQREAVRAWLARSEPSRRSSPGGLPPVPSSPVSAGRNATTTSGTARALPSELASQTKIDAGRASQSGSRPPPVGEPGVSSVSSAVLAVAPDAAPATSTAPAAPPPRRRWGLALAVTALVVVALVGAGGWWRALRPAAPTAGVGVAPASPSVVVAQPATGAPAVAVTGAGAAASVTAAGSSPSTGAAANAAAAATPTPGEADARDAAATATPRARSATGKGRAGAAPAIPDDISHNPYR